MSVREMVKAIQAEILRGDLTPERARDLMMTLGSLMGNANTAIRDADAKYAVVLLQFLDTGEPANRANIRAEITPEYQAKREARDTAKLITVLHQSMKAFLKSLSDEMHMAGSQR